MNANLILIPILSLIGFCALNSVFVHCFSKLSWESLAGHTLRSLQKFDDSRIPVSLFLLTCNSYKLLSWRGVMGSHQQLLQPLLINYFTSLKFGMHVPPMEDYLNLHFKLTRLFMLIFDSC